MGRMKWMLAGIVWSVLMPQPFAASGEPGVLEQTGSAFSAIARAALPAVVFINVEATVEVPRSRYRSPLEEFFGGGGPYGSPYDGGTRKYHQQGQGSGFIISKDGYILTNNHVVNDADRISVTLADGRKFEAQVVGTDPKTEVALIRIESDGDLPFLPLGDSDALQVGEWVLAAGNPFGLSQSITAGIVSAKERSEVGITEYADFIQTDAAINPGNSGGPLLNIRGEVVGINTAIYSRTGGYMGIGFAIPINQAVSIKDQLIAGGTIRRSVLGIFIQEVDEALADTFGLDEAAGILVARVIPDSAAEKAGIKAGDIILDLNGEKVGKTGSFRSRIASIPPGSPVQLKVFRDGAMLDMSATTQAMDEEGSGGYPAPTGGAAVLERLGLSVQDLDDETNEQFGFPESGVLVAGVEQDSPAWNAGLRHGQVILSINRIPVRSAAEFIRLLDKAAENGRVLFLLSDGRGARFVLVPLE